MSTIIIIALLVILTAAVSYLWWKQIQLRNSYRLFFDQAEPHNLKGQINHYAKDVEDALHKLDQLATFSANLHKKSLNAIEKIGLVRFNPFGDTGGDQSFCMVLLNSHDTGLAISSIHARSGTRFYAKEIIKGKPAHPLSEEEQAAFKKATAKQVSK